MTISSEIMQKAELKPCPFCGGTDVHLRRDIRAAMSWVSCVECGLDAPTETGVSDHDAVEYWNRRALQEAVTAARAEERKADAQVALDMIQNLFCLSGTMGIDPFAVCEQIASDIRSRATLSDKEGK